MPVNIELLNSLLDEVEAHIQEINVHTDVPSRLLAVRSNKPLMASYFKYSIKLNHALQSAKLSIEHLEQTLKRFACGTNDDAKKIITFYQTYGKGLGDKGRLQFQVDLAEASALLKHRIANEREHLIPEYNAIKKEYPDAFL